MYSSAANTPTRLAANNTTTKKFLRMTGTGTAGTAPVWDTVTKSDVGLGNVTNDAQIPKSIGQAAGDIIYFSSANTPVRLAKGSDGQVLKLSSGLPTWGTDNNTKNTAGSTNSTSKLFLIGAGSQAANPQTYSNSAVMINVKADGTTAETGSLVATKVYNAVWNDYAEYRLYNDGETPYGKVVCENGDDTVSLSQKRLQKGAMICSDTYGTCMGEVENSIPIAVAGRVLAYPLEPREQFNFFIGDPVCAGPNGTVSIMTKDEAKEYPECIVGYVSAIPQYEE